MMRPNFAELTARIQIRESENIPGTTGGMETGYTIKATVWGSLKPLSMSNRIGAYVRDAQIENQPTHIIRLRASEELGITIEGLQANMYLFVESKDTEGRSFRILSPVDKQERGLLLDVLVREMGKQFGTDALT